MRTALALLILAFAAVIFSIPWSIAMDLALYQALSQQLGDSMRVATDCIDKTEITRAIGLIVVLTLWSIFVLAIDKLLARVTRRKEIIMERRD
jgi:hypothetical protein